MKPPEPRPKRPETHFREESITKPWQGTPKGEKCPRNGFKWESLYGKLNEKKSEQ